MEKIIINCYQNERSLNYVEMKRLIYIENLFSKLFKC